ncbi:hypothetical protein HD553DRAFT_327313 [Filobasidium floriforme]|uniref:uncharacterized protein n=1 Tax=Filobasidium floriforme TaxID=5210 RepID=UPI001E8E08DF|nr:uncharacterized protein HD553DRAFT_327313 [Filobasidium floriforme]KAH8077431.1 hypothetical protein HD553DRAFT_327313 [Filobasidium floriforme]
MSSNTPTGKRKKTNQSNQISTDQDKWARITFNPAKNQGDSTTHLNHQLRNAGLTDQEYISTVFDGMPMMGEVAWMARGDMEHVVDPGWTGKHGTQANSTVEQDADADNNNNYDDHDSKPKAMDPCLIVLVQCLLALDSEATPDFSKLIENYRNKLGVHLDNYDFRSQGPTKDKIRRFICKLLNNAWDTLSLRLNHMWMRQQFMSISNILTSSPATRVRIPVDLKPWLPTSEINCPLIERHGNMPLVHENWKGFQETPPETAIGNCSCFT